jgi:hypothetical protein
LSAPKKSSLFEALNRSIRFPFFRKDAAPEPAAASIESAEPQHFARLRNRLRRTRQRLTSALGKLFAS